MATAPSLITEEGLRVYLNAHSVEYTDVKLLTGGTANYVYRVTLTDGPPVIYKHAAPYLSSNTSFAFDHARMDYEDSALEILTHMLAEALPESNVHAVGWYSYDREQKLLCIEDGGDRDLKHAYPDYKLDILEIGKDIGEWIATLHLTSTRTSLSLTDEQDLKANNPIAVNIYRHSYHNLHLAFSEYNHDVKFAEYINEEFGSRLQAENECVCHGDFWPGNVLVKPKDRETSATLTVVDWEMTRRGNSATDVGQFACEAFLLDRFRGGRGLRRAFLSSYVDVRERKAIKGKSEIGREWVRRMAVHWAVHVAYWPTRVEWTDREGTQKLVDLGVEVMKAAVDGNWEALKSSELFKDVAEVWSGVWERI
ncbi:kinase-like protein [Lindgomyces ingoldianus]|uniref:Kinase-like protein n=1 Tax=Lindgomyces ingoldianus TaxID=673940 RepID=A0ACB6R6F6_9PLEO|nr:kinase-like protein [Lindgomyces ingoldianus]KAF2474413.1 kinase-like protein [Lindgomyces ingoldianus]